VNQAAVEKHFRQKLLDVSDLLANLDITVGFLVSVGGDPNVGLVQFMTDTLKMKTDTQLFMTDAVSISSCLFFIFLCCFQLFIVCLYRTLKHCLPIDLLVSFIFFCNTTWLYYIQHHSIILLCA